MLIAKVIFMLLGGFSMVKGLYEIKDKHIACGEGYCWVGFFSLFISCILGLA